MNTAMAEAQNLRAIVISENWASGEPLDHGVGQRHTGKARCPLELR